MAIITGEKFLGISNDPDHFSINIRKFIFYLFNLFYQIYKNAFKAIIIIITGKTNVTSIKINTNVKNNWHKIILSNSITLTPGTITIHQEENSLTILCLSTNNKNTNELEDMVKARANNK